VAFSVGDLTAGPERKPVLLRCEGLSVRRGRRLVVRNVNLELRAGEVVAVLGPNGAGKSTLLGALAGALEPATGKVERFGRVAMAMQSGDLARRSVIANLTLALSWWGVPRPDRADRARTALRTLGVESLADRPAATLSGGERRRVHLARALALAPDVLMLDEPFAGLDLESRGTLLEDAVSVLRSSERATVVVVHERAEAWALADRLVIVTEGEIVAQGEPGEVLEHPPTAAVARFLGYDGRIEDSDGVLLTRPAHVSLDPAGPLTARVTRAVPQEDGARLELTLERGRVYTVAASPAPSAGEAVRLRLLGGVRLPVEDGLSAAGGGPPDHPQPGSGTRSE